MTWDAKEASPSAQLLPVDDSPQGGNSTAPASGLRRFRPIRRQGLDPEGLQPLVCCRKILGYLLSHTLLLF